MEEWITVIEAAEVSGYHPEHLRELIRSEQILARKFGPLWQVNRSSLIAYKNAAENSEDKRRGPKTS